MGRSEKGSSPSSSASKRRRRNDDYSTSRRKHLYLILDDWKDGYSIHRLDPDDMDLSGHLSKPAALRLGAPVLGWMAFTALGTNIFVDTNRLSRGSHASPTFVYNTENAVLTLGPRIPGDVYNLRTSMAVGEKLYALTSLSPTRVYREPCWSPSLQVLSWAPDAKVQPGDPAMGWSWNTLPTPTPTPINGTEIVTYALHPDGHTIFMSTQDETHSLDTSHGVWKKVGDWVLPFRGQAYFDADLDAWVGLHNKGDGYICCCPVASRCTTTTTPRLECRMLKEKMFRSKAEVKVDHRHYKPTLTYMGDSRFCLVENVLCGEDFSDGAVIRVTLFGLKYDHKGELQTKVRRTTRSYAVSKNSYLFSHAVFWM